MARFLIVVTACLIVVFTCTFVTINPVVHAESPTTHVVAWGETLYSVARIYGIAPQALASVNGIGINSWVYAGQRLAIPSHTSPVDPADSLSPSGYYTVRAGDTLFSIAARFGIDATSLADMNDLPSAGLIYVGWALKVPLPSNPGSRPLPKTTTRVHIVQPGEYLNRIALEYATTAQAIMLSNNLPIEWLVFPGQRLIIPTPADSSASPLPAAVTLDVRISNVPLYRQQQMLTCEQASVAMATRGALSEARLVAAMPRSDNPFLGIRGKTNPSYYGGLTDYGSYAQAIQKGLSALGFKSLVLYGQDYDEFKEGLITHLRANRPVVWWHTWHDTYQVPVSVRTSDGATVKLVPYEHAGVIVAANERGVSYHDPYDASVRFVSWSDHKRVSGYFNNMALVVYQ